MRIQLFLSRHFYLLYLLLNSCDENDMKRRVFLSRLLAAVKRTDFSPADFKVTSFLFMLAGNAFSIDQLLRRWRFVIRLPMSQWGAASSRWCGQVSCIMYTRSCISLIVNRAVWQTQIWRDKIRCFLLKELDCFTSVEWHQNTSFPSQLFKSKQVYRRRYESRCSSKPKLHFKKESKIWWKTIFNMADGILTHIAMWHDHDIDFDRWLHPAMWHVALELTTVNSPSGSTVAAPCNETRSSGIMTLNSPGDRLAAPCSVAGGSGITSYWIRPNVRHIGILQLVSISTISLQSICYSAPVCEILSKLDHPQQKKIMSCRFQDGGSQPSWILWVQ